MAGARVWDVKISELSPGRTVSAAFVWPPQPSISVRLLRVYTGSIIFCLSFAFAGHSTGRYSVKIFQWLDETLTYAMWIISSSTVLRNTRSSCRLGIYSCYCGYDVVATLCESTDRPLSYHSLSTFKKFQSPAKYHRHNISQIFFVPKYTIWINFFQLVISNWIHLVHIRTYLIFVDFEFIPGTLGVIYVV